MTEIATVDERGQPGPKLYLATVIDLYSRRLPEPPPDHCARKLCVSL